MPISRIFKNEEFGYTTLTVERPLRDADGKVILGEKGKQKSNRRRCDEINQLGQVSKIEGRLSSEEPYINYSLLTFQLLPYK